ncbi:SusD/RagB family nutrient-binding outer membrane lipoprotein [Phocaeicola sp.]
MKTKYIATLLLGGFLGFTACTDGFEDDNKIKGGFSDELKEIDFQNLTSPFETIQSGIYFNYVPAGLNWVWQLTQALNHDMFAGYFLDPTPKFMIYNATYSLNAGWTNAEWQYTYGYIYTEIQKAESNFQGNENLKGYLGITEILKVELMHRVADTYGPLVYHKLGEKPKVYGLQEAYTQFFADLDESQKLINEYLAAGGDNNKFKDHDMLTSGKTLKDWLKFANSLRLRLAMRISNVDPVTAKAETLKALDDSNGVLEGAKETIAVAGSTYTNPLFAVAGWGEVCMNASMESIINGYEDPRGEKWYNTASLKGYEDKLLGIPVGLPMQDGDNNIYGACSSLNTNTIGEKTPAILMTAAEVWFLRAEAALRGYTAEDVKTCYENGVSTSFTQWDCSGSSTYLASDNTPANYKDVVSNGTVGKDMDALITISPKWEEGADREVKLEKIITQKWLACWPESYEAWAEQRRTGYPKLFKVQNNTSGGAINTDAMIRRLPFSTDAAGNDPAQYSELCSKLGSTDNGGSRLWWDAGQNNF